MSMKFNKFTAFVVAVVSTVITGVALAQFAKPESAIKYRQSALSVMGTHFARIAAVAKGEVPYNKDDVMKNAAIVNTMASLPWQAFGSGTEGGSALPAIWTAADKFKSSQEKLIAAAASLSSAAQSGDLDAIKKATAATGAACKGCHDEFKKK
jgi:cytochrome c556